MRLCKKLETSEVRVSSFSFLQLITWHALRLRTVLYMVHESLAWRDGLADDPRDRERHDAQSQRKHAECGVAQRVVALAEAEVAQAGQQVRDDRGAGRTHHLREGTRVNVGDFGSTTPVQAGLTWARPSMVPAAAPGRIESGSPSRRCEHDGASRARRGGG